MKKQIAIYVTVFVLVFSLTMSVGSTIAWIMDGTDLIVNTFVPSDINIELTESVSGEFRMVPGTAIAKDPKVTVKANSEPCYLFIKITESANLRDYIEYSVLVGENEWKQYQDANGQDVKGVYYREVHPSTTDQEFFILADNQVLVNRTVTKQMMDAIADDRTLYPTLSFDACAVQRANLTVQEAYAEIDWNTNNGN